MNVPGVAPARAKVIVELPKDATLSVDGRAVRNSTDATRTFSTPELTPGQDYFYELAAEVVRDGQKVTDTKRVIVRAGAEVRASLLNGSAPAATLTAK